MVTKYQLYVCLSLILNLFSIRSKVGQKMGSGFNKTISSYGIIGFVRFLEGYYMILITSRLKAAMLGHHSVFKIADTAMVYIPNEEVRETHPGKHIFGVFFTIFALFCPLLVFFFLFCQRLNSKLRSL